MDDAQREWTLAAAVPIADDEDRAIFLGDLTSEPWFGVQFPPMAEPSPVARS